MSNALSSHPNRWNSTAAIEMRSFVAIILAVWLGVVFWLGARDAFATPEGVPPIPLLLGILIPVALFLFAFWSWHSFRNFVLEADLRLLVGMQAWRFAGVGFLGFYAQGILPGYLAWPAALGDMAIGLTAPWVVVTLLRQPSFARSRVFIGWNILGIVDFGVALGMGAIAPLLFADLARNVTAAPMVHLPLVLNPTFAIPMFIIFHLIAVFHAKHLSPAEGS
jgi:hypothetical protein